MTKILRVAAREYLYNVRRTGFLVGAFAFPLLVIAIMIILVVVVADAEGDADSLGTVGYVDRSGVLAEALEQPASFRAYESEDAAQAALDTGEIGAYYVLAEDYLETGDVAVYARGDVPSALNDRLDTFLVANLAPELDADVRERISGRAETRLLLLDTGRTVAGFGIVLVFLMPIIFVFIFVMASQISGSYLMSGVVEEKANRIMEVLVTSVTPMQLLTGKILGLSVLGLTQLIIWAIPIGVGLFLARESEVLQGLVLPADLLIVGMIYFFLGYFLMAAFMAGVGAVVGSEQESRQIAGLWGLFIAVPFFFTGEFLSNPNGTIPVILTLVPFTSPVAALLRMAFAPIPAEQLAASIVILAITTLVMMWIAARVFRWALLMYGKRPSLRSIFSGLRRREMATTTAAAGE